MFTKQELTVIAYGLEDHIVVLNGSIHNLEGYTDVMNCHLRRAHEQARDETRILLNKVQELETDA